MEQCKLSPNTPTTSTHPLGRISPVPLRMQTQILRARDLRMQPKGETIMGIVYALHVRSWLISSAEHLDTDFGAITALHAIARGIQVSFENAGLGS